MLERAEPYREITPLPEILFLDVWRVEPAMNIPSNLPSAQAQDAPKEDALHSLKVTKVDQAKDHKEEARHILAKAVKTS